MEDKKNPLSSYSSKSMPLAPAKQQIVTKPLASAKAQSISKVIPLSNQAKAKQPNVVKEQRGPKQQVSPSKQNRTKPVSIHSWNKSSTEQKSSGNKNITPKLATARSKTKKQGHTTDVAQNKARPQVQQAKSRQPQRETVSQVLPSSKKSLLEKNRKFGPGAQNPKISKQKEPGVAALSKNLSKSRMKVSGKPRKPSPGIANQNISKQTIGLDGKQRKSKATSLRNKVGGPTSKQQKSNRRGGKLCKRGAGGSCLQSNESEMMTQSSSQRALIDTMYSGSGSLREHGRTTTRYIQDHKTKFGLDLLKQTAPVLGGAAACAGVCCKGQVCGVAASSVAAATLGGAAITAGCIGGVGPECYKGYKSYKAGTKAKAEEERRRTQERVVSLENRVQGTERNLHNVRQGIQRSTAIAEAALENVETLQNEAIVLPPVIQNIPDRPEDTRASNSVRSEGAPRGRGGRRGSPIQGSA